MPQYSQTTTINPSGQETFLNTMKTLQGVGQVAGQLGGLGLDYAKLKQNEVNAQNDLALRKEQIAYGRGTAQLEFAVKYKDYDAGVEALVNLGYSREQAENSATNMISSLMEDEDLAKSAFYALNGKAPDKNSPSGFRDITDDESLQIIGSVSGKIKGLDMSVPYANYKKEKGEKALYDLYGSSSKQIKGMNERQKLVLNGLNLPKATKQYISDAWDTYWTQADIKTLKEMKGEPYSMDDNIVNNFDDATALFNLGRAGGDINKLRKKDLITLGVKEKADLEKLGVDKEAAQVLVDYHGQQIETEKAKQAKIEKETGQIGEGDNVNKIKKITDSLETIKTLKILDPETYDKVTKTLKTELDKLTGTPSAAEEIPEDIPANDKEAIESWNALSLEEKEVKKKIPLYKQFEAKYGKYLK